MAQREAGPSIPHRRRSDVDLYGIVRRVCGAQAGGAQRRVAQKMPPDDVTQNLMDGGRPVWLYEGSRSSHNATRQQISALRKSMCGARALRLDRSPSLALGRYLLFL